MTHPILLKVDPEWSDEIERLRKEGGFEDVGELIGHCLRLHQALWDARSLGFLDVTVSNPQSGDIMILKERKK